jgi:parallel beta-helix repeat protein
MRKICTLFLILVLCFAVVSISDREIVKAESKTIDVPDDYLTIQEAINNSDEGDTIFVKSGTYFENLVINKSVSLIGENSYSTIIDGNYTKVYEVIRITSDNVKITGFTIKKSGGVKYYEKAGINIEYSNGNNISYNIITDNYGNGIHLESSSNNLILKNNITENLVSGIAIMYSSHNNTINGNTLTDNFDGIYISDSDNQHVVQNIVEVSGNNGIDFDDSSNNVVVGNIVSDSYNYGMVIYRSASDVIHGNRLSNNAKGIYLSFSENNTIFQNNMTNNEHGLDIGLSSNNLIYENILSHNDIGILLSSTTSENNTIWNNDFMDNTKQALNDALGATLFWDNGSEGNYWSDYTGTDNNGDGIGDTPYIIDEKNQDNFPLIELVVILEFPSWIILPLLTVVSLVIIVARKKLLRKGSE